MGRRNVAEIVLWRWPPLLSSDRKTRGRWRAVLMERDKRTMDDGGNAVSSLN